MILLCFLILREITDKCIHNCGFEPLKNLEFVAVANPFKTSNLSIFLLRNISLPIFLIGNTWACGYCPKNKDEHVKCQMWDAENVCGVGGKYLPLSWKMGTWELALGTLIMTLNIDLLLYFGLLFCYSTLYWSGLRIRIELRIIQRSPHQTYSDEFIKIFFFSHDVFYFEGAIRKKPFMKFLLIFHFSLIFCFLLSL